MKVHSVTLYFELFPSFNENISKWEPKNDIFNLSDTDCTPHQNVIIYFLYTFDTIIFWFFSEGNGIPSKLKLKPVTSFINLFYYSECIKLLLNTGADVKVE